MSRDADLRRILDCGIVAVVRAPDPGGLVEVVRALPGETTDGHLYIQDAFRRGAVAALIQRDPDPTDTSQAGAGRGGPQEPGGPPARPYETRSYTLLDMRGPAGPSEVLLPVCLRVGDTLKALQRVAAEWRTTSSPGPPSATG